MNLSTVACCCYYCCVGTTKCISMELWLQRLLFICFFSCWSQQYSTHVVCHFLGGLLTWNSSLELCDGYVVEGERMFVTASEAFKLVITVSPLQKKILFTSLNNGHFSDQDT